MLRLRRPPLVDMLFVAVWCALTITALIPVWHQRMLPMLDTPDHLALARAWHSYYDPKLHISDYYILRVRVVPYFAFYALVNLLLYVCSIEIANKLILSLYLIVFPLAILALARALGRSRWLALGGFVLAFNPGWIYGFGSYLLGTCFLYFGLAALIRYLDGGERRFAVLLGVTTLLAYLCHVMVWALFGICALVLIAQSLPKWRRGLVACVAMLPSLMLAVLAYVQEQQDHAYMRAGDSFAGYWRDVPTSLLEAPKRMMELFPGRVDMWVLATLAATTVGLLVWPQARRRTVNDVRLRWLLWTLGLAYLTLPYSIKQPMSWWYVAPRVPALMAPLIFLLPSIDLSGRRALLMTPTVLALVAIVIRLTVLYGDFNRRNIGFMRLVDRLPPGKPTLVLARGLVTHDPEASGDPSSSAPVYWHFMSWPMALKGAFSPYLFDQGIPVHPRPGTPHYNVSRSDVLDFTSAPEFTYYIVHSSSDVLALNRVRIEAVDGAWTLYRRVAAPGDEP